jgi:chemotaxis protein MotB
MTALSALLTASKSSKPLGLRVSKGVLFLGLALSLSGLTGCATDENKRLTTALEQARQQLAEAEDDRRNALAKIAELEAKIAELNRLIDANSGGVGALRRERDLLAQQLADLQKRYDDLVRLGASQPALPPDVNNALRDLAAQYPDLLEFDERLGMIRFKSDLTFDPGSTEVKPRAREALAAFARILNNPEIAHNEVQVVGHTDDIPIRAGGPTAARNPDNWTLSTNRAWSVLAVLRQNGLSEQRGMAGGWGEQRPVAANAPGNRGNERNRRVDIYIRPTTVPEGIVVSTPGARPAAPAAARPATPRTPAAPRTGTARPAAAPATRPSTPAPAGNPGGAPMFIPG